MSNNDVGITCPECNRSHEEIARSCSGCGYELTSQEDFYPALWAYGCPDHEECRERLAFEDGKLHCPRHGWAYLPGELRLDEPIVFDTFTIFEGATHVLIPISDCNSREFDHYTVMPCPRCDPSSYFVDPDGPLGIAKNSLYTRNDAEGGQLYASCRNCGLSHTQYGELLSRREQKERHDSTWLGSRIDYVADSILKTESLIESIPTKILLEENVPRWQQVAVGLVSLTLSGLLAIGSVGASSMITDGTAINWQSLLLPAVTFALSVFFGLVSYRLLLNRPRGPVGGLLSPFVVIAFGVFFSSVGIWMFFSGDGDSTIILSGLTALSIGVAWRHRSRSATRDDPSRKSDPG